MTTSAESSLNEHAEGESHRPPNAPALIVGIGASAGGLEAIEAYFTHTDPTAPFAYVVVQHLSPDYKSLMVEILSKKTSMPVRRAENGMQVEAATVYLIPPKRNLTIFHGTLLLHEQDFSQGLNLPIDVFFQSLAADQGEQAVAVVLSGTGSDGTRGVRSIKEHGGIIMVQDESTARFDGMPRAAAATGLADFILAPEDMPKQLLDFSRHPQARREQQLPAAISDEEGLTRILAHLRDQAKVDFTQYKRTTVTRRIERRMQINRLTDVREYVGYLQQVPTEASSLFKELLIGVTSFFRDPAVFTRLREQVIPDLIEATGHREIRMWVTACSTGEEAYTLAMLFRRVLEEQGVSRDIKIFATDIDRDAIHFAAVGSYPESVAADIPEPFLSKYFYRRDDHFQISRTIREMVVFAPHNLIKDPPFTNIDLVSCRNLLIYLNQEAQAKVLSSFNFSLRRGGVLLLGSSETTGEMGDHFEPIEAKLRIYRARGTSRGYAEVGAIGAHDTRSRDFRRQIGGRRVRATDDGLLDRFVEAIRDDYIPTTAIVNEQLEVLHIIGETTSFFRFPTGRPTMEIDRIVVKGLTVPLTTGIQKVFRTHAPIRFSGIRLPTDEETITVEVRIVPLPERPSTPPLVAVLIAETGRTRPSDDETQSYDADEQTRRRMEDLEQQLQFTRENLQATIEELETSNEELQATNEELLASNEELQSTNEELQSTNEELYTVNSEYQNKILELTELTNDVDNLLESSGIGTILLDEDFAVRRFSKQATSAFALEESDVGRPISHINHRFVDFDPFKAMQSVEEEGARQEWRVRSQDGGWVLFRVMPYRVTPSDTSGLIVSTVDITELMTAQEDRARTQELLSHVADTSPALVWMSDTTKLCNWFNKTWLDFTGRTMEQELGNGWTQGVHPQDYDMCLRTYIGAFDRREPFKMEYRLRRHDGEFRWLLDEGTPRFDSNGSFLGYVGSCLDVTDSRLQREELEKSREQYRMLSESLESSCGSQDEIDEQLVCEDPT